MPDKALYDEFKTRLTFIDNIGQLRRWMYDLRSRISLDHPASGPLSRWLKTLEKVPEASRLVDIDKEWGNLYSIADNLLHHATGMEKSFDPTWAQTVFNGARATADAALQMTISAADKTKELAKAGVGGLGWTLWALPVLAVVGIYAFANSAGKRVF